MATVTASLFAWLDEGVAGGFASPVAFFQLMMSDLAAPNQSSTGLMS